MVRLDQLADIAIVFVIAGIAMGIGAEVLYDVEQDLTAGTTARAAVGNTTEMLF